LQEINARKGGYLDCTVKICHASTDAKSKQCNHWSIKYERMKNTSGEKFSALLHS
jgi:hypothetical protein